MKILDKFGINEIGGANKPMYNFIENQKELIDAVATLEVTEGVLFSGKEWMLNYPPSSTLFTKYFESIGVNKKFSMKKLGYGKEFVIKRIV